MAKTKKTESDAEVMARLRAPIEELVAKHCSDKTEFQKIRLRQLPWQALDVLIRTKNVAGLEHDQNIKRLIQDVRQLGASQTYIQESLHLARSIYQNMQQNYSGLLKRYG
ncbi:hypothetical protein ACFLZP_02765 [Patescibacteria group bacterium]